MDRMRISNGRVLEFLEVGDPRGRPVVYLHGTPGTAGSAALFEHAARHEGVRLVAVSRPGYGESTTTVPGLLSGSQDIAELANQLEIDTFGVLGVSGGGPFALAVGAALPTRVRSIVVAAGPGPYHEIAPDKLAPEDLQAIDLLAAGDVEGAVAVVSAEVVRDFDPIVRLPASEFEAAFSASGPPTEHYFDTRPDDRAVFFADLRRALDRYDGFIRDNLSWCGPWDFDLRDVVAPVRLSYGASDAMGPLVHGEWLHERLPKADLTVHPEAGHGEVCFGLAQWSLSALSED
ncbi:MAG: alpha/beta hydrolase [Actinomycetota bacterium]|nr:alpha/beta hydrolase [Actinomycetota bacterium]